MCQEKQKHTTKQKAERIRRNQDNSAKRKRIPESYKLELGREIKTYTIE